MVMLSDAQAPRAKLTAVTKMLEKRVISVPCMKGTPADKAAGPSLRNTREARIWITITVPKKWESRIFGCRRVLQVSRMVRGNAAAHTGSVAGQRGSVQRSGL